MIDSLYKQTIYNYKDFIECLYISAISKNKVFDKEITKDLLEKFLQRRGYIVNYLLGQRIYIKGFVCINIESETVEIWHDTNCKRNKSFFINESLLTTLPIVLNYFEKI